MTGEKTKRGEKKQRNEEIVQAIDAGVSQKKLAEKYGISSSRVGQLYKRAKEESYNVEYNAEREELKNFLRSIMRTPDEDLLDFILYKFFRYGTIETIDDVKDIIYITICGIVGADFINSHRLKQLNKELFNERSLVRNGSKEYRDKIIYLLSRWT